jgi:proline iminopeptidase
MTGLRDSAMRARCLNSIFVATALFAAKLTPAALTFPTSCGSLAYDEFGEGKPIVLLAGGPGMNPAYVIPVAKILADAGRRVILLHQRGTGKSAGALSCTEQVNIAGAIADLEQLRQYLKLEKLTVAGHSWGGMLAMAYAQEHPGNVAGLLLVDSGPPDVSGFAAEDAAVRAKLTPPDQAALKAASTDEQRERIERKVAFADPGKASLVDASIPAGEPLWYPQVSKLMAQGFQKWDVTHGMKALGAPLVLVFGREDPGFSFASRIQSLQPKSRLIAIAHAGHYPWLEQPAETASALKIAATTLP